MGLEKSIGEVNSGFGDVRGVVEVAGKLVSHPCSVHVFGPAVERFSPSLPLVES